MTEPSGSSSMGTPEGNGPTRLRGAQRRIRDAYFEHDNGLFVLNCNPGAGKSVTVNDVGAEELLRRFDDGNPTPEQHICVISFARDDAAKLVPKIIARLRQLVTHDLTPAAAAVSNDELAYLVDRVRDAPYIGTIDSLCRSLLSEFVNDVGFDTMPAVETDGRLDRLHAACYEEVAADAAYGAAIDVVEAAYPAGEYDDGPAALLRQAHHHCRARRLTTDEFRRELNATVEAVYAEGETTSMSDVIDAVDRCVDADQTAAITNDLDDVDQERLVSADQRLQAAWRETIDAFCRLLAAYREVYVTNSRERGVISHTDCAFLVAKFLGGELGTTDDADAIRKRVLAGVSDRIESVIIDEAQDVSELQHGVLAQLVTEDCRVLAAGDLRQSVYGFRDAHPSIFERAAQDGRYCNIDWQPHMMETAATTYRCVPDVAGAINAIAEPALTGSTRGNIGDLDVSFPRLAPARDPTTDPSVHIAAFDTTAYPGTQAYVTQDTGTGEAGTLATYIASGLADGTLATTEASTSGRANADTGDGAARQPDVTVLFRWRSHMAEYAEAFRTEGLTVANASEHLFDCPAVKTVLNVVDWLVNPTDPDHVKALVTDAALGLNSVADAFCARDWQLAAVREDPPESMTIAHRDVLDRLSRLCERRPTMRAQPVAITIADIIDLMGLRADPNDTIPEVAPAQRVANLDALVHYVRELEADPPAGLADLLELFDPVRAAPHTGPTQPATTTDNHDVVFKTIHQMKGDENDIVALADIGYPLRKHGPVSQRFVATGSMVGLAPPTHAAAPDIEALPGYTRGLFDPGRDDNQFGSTIHPRDVGLRWVSEHWSDQTGPGEVASPDLVGHDRVQTAVRLRRAEAYRLLFVALTRARDHLVVPLPRNIPGPERPRDRWLEPIRDGLGFDGTPGSGTYILGVETADAGTRSIDVAVNAVDALGPRSTPDDTAAPTPLAATTPPDSDAFPSLIPRFIRPSTLAPLSDNLEANLLEHLQGRPLHTDTETVDVDLPLTLDAFDTEDVGAFVHSTLAECVQRDLSAQDLRTPSDVVEQIIDDELQAHGPPATATERDGLIEFLTVWVLPDFVASELWTQLQKAETVYTEKPLRGHIERDGVEFELHGQADFVLEYPDGSWTITETKITLTTMTNDTRRRYQHQVACYAWLLATETDVNDPDSITTAIETFGADTDRTVEQTSPASILDRLDDLLEGDGGR